MSGRGGELREGRGRVVYVGEEEGVGGTGGGGEVSEVWGGRNARERTGGLMGRNVRQPTSEAARKSPAHRG